MRPNSIRFTLVILAFIVSIPFEAFAQTDIYIRGSGKLFPIALPQLCLQQGESQAVKEIPQIIARDLDLSGYFEVVSPDAYIETPGKCGGPESVVYTDWTVIGVEGLVRGTVIANGGNLTVQLYLYDVQKRSMVLGKEYSGDASQIKKISHRFANEILKFFTGEYGPFGTQISFSSRVGRFKELFVMDIDGSEIRQLTNDRGLAISSSWAPDGIHLVYTSYRNRVPDLFRMNINSRSVTQLTRGEPLELGAKYKRSEPASELLLASITTGRDSDIVLLNMSGAVVQRITPSNGAIDVSPEWSPDNSRIAFCSNRGGGPQIYTMAADGSNVKRISFVTSNYCTSPSWSPKGDKIAFVCRADAGFQIFVANADGSNALQLTSSGSNEDPDWSPDGRYLVFATTQGRAGSFVLAMMRSDGTSMKQLTSSRGGDSEPSWGPWEQ
ncbi:MAG: PD40 domain-containing protein [Deltaproteobacteria bacterium]|nr:PD40 domain-containing protein [Deltaproteobacteria bacterium]